MLMALLRSFLLALSLLWVLHSNGALAATGDGNITTPITVGSAAAALTPTHNTFWISPNKTFALGFLQAGSSPSFSLSLFYFQLPQLEPTVVWTANRGHLVSANSSLQITGEGDLVLSDSGVQVWHTNTSGQGVASAVVSEHGNLILNGRNSSNIVWQSWDQDSMDTLLPGQSLLLGMSMVDGKGKYRVTMQTDQNFVMYFLGALTIRDTKNPYWMSDTWNLSATQAYYNASDGLVLYNNKTGHIVKVLLQTTPSSQRERIVLSESGVLTRYMLSSDLQSWKPVIQVPSSICTVVGLCGQYGLCSVDAQNMTDYNCSCPDGFNFLNPNDWSAGCRSNYPLDCNLGTKMTKLPGVRYSTHSAGKSLDYHYDNNATSEDACVKACNASCFCAAATFDGQDCLLSTLGQVNTGNTLNSSSVTYLKTSVYPANNIPSSHATEKQGKREVISTGAAVGIGIALGLASLAGLANLARWYAQHKQSQNEEDQEGMGGDNGDQLPLLGGPVYFSYKEMRAATNGFSQLLGRGGFGPVYKGMLAGGTLVAVKRLEGSTFGDKQFKAEVRTIGSVHHMNLVRLLGFCAKGSHRMLVYDFMAKGSLDKYIFYDPQSEGKNVIDWETRFQVVISTARAIKYLHEECQPCIVHCDIKPENILLDEDFNAKVSDFGMAQLLGGEANTGSITRMKGTAGYMAPEWTSSKRISSKADVYSFGIVVLEVMSGRRAIETEVESVSMVELSTWAYDQLMDHCNPLALLDSRLLPPATLDATPPHLTPEFQRAAFVALWCIHKDPSVRPSMGSVLQILEGLVPVDPPPYPF